MAPPLSLVFLVLAAVSLSASAAAAVLPRGAVPAKSGYLPIPSANASLYFAFYEATEPIGPYLFAGGSNGSGGGSLSPNPFAWNRRFGLVFIDSPLGTGFSVAPSPAAIPTNQSVVAEHVLAALQSFFALEPSFRARPLYLTGESYAGKTIPAAGSLADTSHEPEVTAHADIAYFMGLINGKQKREAEAMQAKAVELVKAERWSEAYLAREGLLGWMENASGVASLFDVEEKRSMLEVAAALVPLLNGDEVKAALGARGDVEWKMCSAAGLASREMIEDWVFGDGLFASGGGNH
uniref:Carboxypeptidase n=1 Tax=Oryza brachyantha TaxID=4533 RepID=J3MA51_ORYBR